MVDHVETGVPNLVGNGFGKLPVSLQVTLARNQHAGSDLGNIGVAETGVDADSEYIGLSLVQT